jgi:hypothetical protein
MSGIVLRFDARTKKRRGNDTTGPDFAAMIIKAAFKPWCSGYPKNGACGSGRSGRSSEARPTLAPPHAAYSGASVRNAIA